MKGLVMGEFSAAPGWLMRDVLRASASVKQMENKKMTTADAAPKCHHCGGLPHQGVCPTIKAIEYHPDGAIKRVEYKTNADNFPHPYPQYGAACPGYHVVTYTRPSTSCGYGSYGGVSG